MYYKDTITVHRGLSQSRETIVTWVRGEHTEKVRQDNEQNEEWDEETVIYTVVYVKCITLCYKQNALKVCKDKNRYDSIWYSKIESLTIVCISNMLALDWW